MLSRYYQKGRKPGGNVQVTFYVERDDEEIELEISAHVSPYDPGRLYGPPEDCYPPEGGECEIYEVLCDGEKWDGELTDGEKEQIEEEIAERLEDEIAAAEEDAAEAAAEMRRMRYEDSDEVDYIYDPW